jgi:3-oxoacyl-[acyl-carrier-protein] synthase III
MTVHLTGLGTYVPPETMTGADIAAESGVPEEVVTEKILDSGDTVLYLAAGTGYTWAATVLEWQD